MKRYFQRHRDDRFALTTLQNPNLEVRTYAELVQAAQQEREWQPTALRIPATQPLATPAAPDSIPTSGIPVSDESTALDPVPTIPAPLDSANSDAGNPDFASPNSTNDDAQQILESLVADVVTTGTALPSFPSLASSDDELAPHSAPKPRRKPKSKPRRKSNRGTGLPAVAGNLACAPSAPSTETQDPNRDQSAALTFIKHHSRKCSICRHPERQQIDESFLHWRSPQTIMHCFGIKTETTIYRHAHAFNFFALRNRNLQSALCNIIENIDTRDFSGREMLDAVRALAHLTADGRWIHPTSKSEVMYSMQRLPAAAGLPAHTNAHPAVADEPILIASRPNIKNTMQTTENNQRRPSLIASFSAVLAASGRELWARWR
jgi:hypothetical protein